MFLLLSVVTEEPVEIPSWPRLHWEGPEVRGLAEPTAEQILIALALVAQGKAHSAAILAHPPPVDRRWLAYEFQQAVVTDSSIDPGPLRALGWRPDPHDGYTVWQPPGPRPADFVHGLLGTVPMTVEVSAWHDLADTELFGPFASGRQGGSSALMALSGARPGPGSVSLRNPAALDLELLTDADSVPALIAQRAISVVGVGASSSTTAAAFDLQRFTDPDAALRAWDAAEHLDGYWLLIEVAALVDPRVGIPPGHIFEQESVNGVQTLAIASARSFVVDVGKPHTVVVPAWCLNMDLQPPSGQQVNATPLRARYTEGTPQHAVWEHRRQVMAS